MARKPKDTQPRKGAEAGNEMVPEESSSKREAFVERNKDGGEGSKKERVSFAINEDGVIDVESLRSANKSKIKELFADARNRAALGLNSNEGLPEGFQITEEAVRSTLQGLQKVNAFATRFCLARFKKFNIDPDILQRCYSFTPEQLSELVPRGTRLANKYAPEWMRKYQDEIFFLGLYFSYTAQQAQAAIMYQSHRNQVQADQRAAAEAAKGSQPGVPNGKAAETQ